MEKNKVVMGIVLNKEGKLLIIERSDGILPWAFPGGVIESGEKFQDTVAREVLEETGYSVLFKEKLSEKDHPDFPVHITYAACILKDNKKKEIKDPDIEQVQWIDPSEIKKYFATDIDTGVMEYLEV